MTTLVQKWIYPFSNLPFVCFCLLSASLEAGDAAVRVRGERRMLLQRRLSGVSHQLHPGPLSGHTRGGLCPRLGRKLIIFKANHTLLMKTVLAPEGAL